MAILLYTKAWNINLSKELERHIEKQAKLLEKVKTPDFVKTKAEIKSFEPYIKKYSKYKHIVCLGQGGSIRPLWALYKALYANKIKKKLYIVDGTDPSAFFGRILNEKDHFTPKNTLIISISKSGETAPVLIETLELVKRGFKILTISTKNHNTLYQSAVKNFKTDFFPHPPNIGGRFTATQNNVMLPLAILEGKTCIIERILQGFEDAYIASDPKVVLCRNMAKTIALELYKAELAGLPNVFSPIYCRALQGVGEWLLQLNHETYGKKNKGMTFLISIGPETQHHTMQRYFGGKKDIVGLSIAVDRFSNDSEISVPTKTKMKIHGRPVKELQGMKFGTFLELEHLGVIQEAKQRKQPHMVLTLSNLIPENVGKLMGLWEYIAVYASILRGVNPYDQPEVEGSKNKTKSMLKSWKKGKYKCDFVNGCGLSI